MKLFECQSCGQLLYFENTRCEQCGHLLGYLSDRSVLSALAPGEGGVWYPLAAPDEPFIFCANAGYEACNWLVSVPATHSYCRACRLNRIIPDLGTQKNILLWRRLEAAKHRLVYSLLRFGLPLASKSDDPRTGLAFVFLSGTAGAFSEAGPVRTGHAQGVITIDIAEADDAERERHRQDMVERYRTLLGHFRHEIGHYYWERLVRDGVWHHAFRDMFGDERQDYGSALQTHYANGPPADWQENHISAYASSHPWEDFAETWAHYLHIVDTLETAHAFGLSTRPGVGHNSMLDVNIDFDPYRQPDFDAMLAAWLPLTYTVNGLNQSMGQPDLYPFVLAPSAMGKLRFIHGLVHPQRG